MVAILVAVTCGIGIGAGTAVLKIRQHPWIGGFGTPPSVDSGRVTVDHETFDFGKMDSTEDGTHDYIFTNRGDKKLTLNHGSTSCSCTVSEIKDSELAPGESTKVTVSWHSKGRIGPFQQSVTVITSDPLRREVTLTVKGEFTRSVYAEPDELTFNHIGGTESVTQEARIFCNLPNQQIKIQSYQMSDPSLEKFFQVEYVPLGADGLRKEKGATSGILIRVTAKPGLPLGRFQQRILFKTNLAQYTEFDLPLFGSVGEVSLVGRGWNSETGMLDIGTVDGRSVTQRKLIVLARGPHAKDMKFKIASVEPDFLQAKLGKATVRDTELSETELIIEIPENKILEKKTPANYLGGEHGKLGEILLETIHPQPYSLRIRVRFAVAGGT